MGKNSETLKKNQNMRDAIEIKCLSVDVARELFLTICIDEVVGLTYIHILRHDEEV